MIKFGHLSIFLLLLTACYKGEEADLIIHNAKIYSCDANFAIYEAMAIRDGKIIQLGPEHEIMNGYRCDNKIDAQLKPVYPGFYDAHCHFEGYANKIVEVDLLGCRSFDEVVGRIVAYEKDNELPFIKGRGWDQSLWNNTEFPTNDTLNVLFPDKPLLISRVDGHASLANQKALDLAGITDSITIDGGIFGKDENGLTGLLIDNAHDMVAPHLPELSDDLRLKNLQEAEYNLFQVGLTSINDAGISANDRKRIVAWYESGELNIKNYTMLFPDNENITFASKNGIYKNGNLTIRSFKLVADGAMGSRGACLLEPYSDDPDNYGLILSPEKHYREVAELAKEIGYQVNTHCIGDSANRMIFKIYKDVVQEVNDHRWKIEHAQLIDSSDFHYFRDLRIVPSVQPTHCTSDMRWVEERVGEHRAPYSYAYKKMLEYVDRIALGTDFPVEDINPMKTFYAAITRQDAEGNPEGGFYPDERLSRKEALLGMTLWAAWSNFEENSRGSLEEGKDADFVFLTNDIMRIPEKDILSTHVIRTFMDGEEVYYSD